ncbi:MAG: hypothetical protein U0636_02185 [Phycisphaerales bacterium]
MSHSFIILAVAAALGQGAPASAPPPPTVAPAPATAAAPLPAVYELAFKIGSTIPADPHERDRARMQQAVALACREHGLLEDATRYASSIAGWRRPEALALIGQSYVTQGQESKARDVLVKATLLAQAEGESYRDRVNTEVARGYAMLNDLQHAAELAPPASAAELCRLDVARLTVLPADKLDEQADAFDRAIALKNFDIARAAIDGYQVWLGRVATDAPRRSRALKALESAIPGLPLDLQVAAHLRTAEALWNAGLKPEALEALARAQQILSTGAFLPEDVAPLLTPVALAELKMVSADKARATLASLRSRYEELKEQIVDLRRARSLRALGEAWATLGDRQAAAACFAEALEEGSRNPNARPRAMDLCLTCVSMANVGMQPSKAMQERIEAIQAGLKDPW